jgi:hypothetical protein
MLKQAHVMSRLLREFELKLNIKNEVEEVLVAFPSPRYHSGVHEKEWRD